MQAQVGSSSEDPENLLQGEGKADEPALPRDLTQQIEVSEGQGCHYDA